MAAEAALDAELASLRSQVDDLRSELTTLSTNLLIHPAIRDKIISATSGTPPAPPSSQPNTPRDFSRLRKRLDQQLAHNQQCLYRVCAGVTTFRVKDPDPNAVDDGTVLGLRIDVMARAKFVEPYYVFLNRPYGKADDQEADAGEGRGIGRRGRGAALRVHRHTIPACIPVAGLAARYLPEPSKQQPRDEQEGGEKKQDLAIFARHLRRELVRYHNRDAIVRDLRKQLGLDDAGGNATGSSGGGIAAISSADAEMKQVSIEWKDGRTGRLVVDEDGKVSKLVILKPHGGRDHVLMSNLGGKGTQMEDVARRLLEV